MERLDVNAKQMEWRTLEVDGEQKANLLPVKSVERKLLGVSLRGSEQDDLPNKRKEIVARRALEPRVESKLTWHNKTR